MRSLILLAAFCAYMAPIFVRPFVGVLVWMWIAIGTPHLETFGFTKSFQFNLIVAVLTIFCWLITKKDARVYKYFPIILMYVFALIMLASTYLGLAPDYSSEQLSRVLKIFVLVFVIVGMIDSRTRIHACFWVIAISLGYFGAKAGLGTIATGGSFRVSGPLGGPLGDNNHTAAAFVMLVPILNYLRLESRSKLVRWLIVGVILLTLIGIIGTYSRGGFIGMSAMLGYYWLRSRGKLRNALIVLVLATVGASLVPQKYYDRLSTIESAEEEDQSFKERLGAWQTAISIANQRPLGVGFRAYQLPSVFGRYKEDDFWRESMAMHSVYFEVTADLGYVGLFLYLTICGFMWRNLMWIIGATEHTLQLKWANTAARMIEISFAGFAVAGAALSMAFFEPLWVLIGISLAMRAVVERYLERSPSTVSQDHPSAQPASAAAAPPAHSH